MVSLVRDWFCARISMINHLFNGKSKSSEMLTRLGTIDQGHWAIKFKCVKRLRVSKPDVAKVNVATMTPPRITCKLESDEMNYNDPSNHMRICDRQLARIKRRTQHLRQRDREIRKRLAKSRRQDEKVAYSYAVCDVTSPQETSSVPTHGAGCNVSGELISAQNTQKETGSEMCVSLPGQLMETEIRVHVTLTEPCSNVSFSTCMATNEKDNVICESETGRDSRPISPGRPSQLQFVPQQPCNSAQEELNMTPEKETFENGKCATPVKQINSESVCEKSSKSLTLKAFVGERYDFHKRKINYPLFNTTKLSSFRKDLCVVAMTSPKSLGISPRRLRQKKPSSISRGMSVLTRGGKLSKLNIANSIMKKFWKTGTGCEILK